MIAKKKRPVQVLLCKVCTFPSNFNPDNKFCFFFSAFICCVTSESNQTKKHEMRVDLYCVDLSSILFQTQYIFNMECVLSTVCVWVHVVLFCLSVIFCWFICLFVGICIQKKPFGNGKPFIYLSRCCHCIENEKYHVNSQPQ